MTPTPRYTIERLTPSNIDRTIIETAIEIAKILSEAYGNKFDWQYFRLQSYVQKHRLMVCRRDGVIVGVMLSRLLKSVFDGNTTVLYQDLLWARPKTRAAKLLMDDFIDFGSHHADHILTCIGKKTGIKPRTLERMGFDELETFYRMETKRI